METITKAKFIKGSLWKILETLSLKGVTFIVSIILSRLVMPEEFGLLGLTTIFLSFAGIFVEGGFGTALVRKKELDDKDYTSVLVTSFAIAVFFYIVFFFCAPLIANFYKEESLVLLIRIVSLSLFISATGSVRSAVIYREMRFRFLCICNFVSSLISGALGVFFAYKGLGVWALVIQQLSSTFISMVIMFWKLDIHFKWNFSFTRLKEIFSFSSGIILSSLLSFAGGKVYDAVIGKKYSVADLAYYGKGVTLPEQVSLYTFSSISNVLLPTLSSYQDDISTVKRITRKVSRMTAFLVFPMMAGLILVSYELIVILFTDVWLPAVPMMKAWSVYYLATPFTLMNVQVFLALGHSYTRIKVELTRMAMLLLSVAICLTVFNFSIVAFAWTGAVIMIISTMQTAYEAKKLIDYRLKEIFSDLVKPAVAASIMFVVSEITYRLVIVPLTDSLWISLIAKVFLGCGLYFILSRLLKIDELNEVLNTVKGLLKRK